jgi:hypothetical protein
MRGATAERGKQEGKNSLISGVKTSMFIYFMPRVPRVILNICLVCVAHAAGPQSCINTIADVTSSVREGLTFLDNLRRKVRLRKVIGRKLGRGVLPDCCRTR